MFSNVLGAFAPYLVVGLLCLMAGALLAFGWDGRPAGSFLGPGVATRYAADQRELSDLYRAQRLAQARLDAQGRASAAATARSAADDARAQARVQTVYRTLVREIPGAVPPTTARACMLPVGWLRAHDAAARGVDLSAVPDPAGRPDGAPGDQSDLAVAQVVAANYGGCAGDRQRLVDLQAWVDAQGRVFSPFGGPVAP